MASIAFSNVTSASAAQAVTTAKAAPVQAATADKVSGELQPDTVKLSLAAQAKLMHREGQSPALIAANLGANISDVNSYLGITTATTSAVMAAAVSQAAPAATATPAATSESPAPAAK